MTPIHIAFMVLALAAMFYSGRNLVRQVSAAMDRTQDPAVRGLLVGLCGALVLGVPVTIAVLLIVLSRLTA